MSDQQYQYEPFDPLAVENVGATIAIELLQRPLHSMPPEQGFRGAGIYALYYSGNHSAYTSLVELDGGRNRYPLYIGKASGESAKQGFNPRVTSKKTLFSRIVDHSRSISQASNLEVQDFRCRFLILNDAYIALAESVMIRLFRPVWNGMSFGSKVVGKYRMTGEAALWDSLHPGRGGRPVGSSVRGDEAAELIARRVAELRSEPADPIVRRMHDRIMRFA